MTVLLITCFVIGYLLIATEHQVRVNKAAVALITGVVCWTIFTLYSGDPVAVNAALGHHLGELSGILFFLLGAMTIVELIDSHDGFDLITNRISATNKVKLLWITGLLAFVLSALLDNLTTTIVLVSLLRKLMSRETNRLLFCGVIVIAANAGGAWSPIGDVTTTMLWIGGQITTAQVISTLILPSLACALVPLGVLSLTVRGHVSRPDIGPNASQSPLSSAQQSLVFFSGVGLLLMVPVFKTVTGLPPYMGMLLALAVLWVITEVVHGKMDEADKHKFSVVYALRKIDTPSILFFFGILAAIAALESAGLLEQLAGILSRELADDRLIVLVLGLVSAIIDNVPLVAAAQGMYSLDTYPVDHAFWHFLAYCTGTGGSTLIIGSAAGVAAMGMENIGFGWYLRKMSWLALIGYLAGALVFLATSAFV